MDYRSNSQQIPSVLHEKNNFTMCDKVSIVKTKCNNNNFKAGYMPVENMKPEMRGRKTFAFWTLLILLFLLVIGNLALTITIIGVLKLGQGKCGFVHLRTDLFLMFSNLLFY